MLHYYTLEERWGITLHVHYLSNFSYTKHFFLTFCGVKSCCERTPKKPSFKLGLLLLLTFLCSNKDWEQVVYQKN